MIFLNKEKLSNRFLSIHYKESFYESTNRFFHDIKSDRHSSVVGRVPAINKKVFKDAF